MTWYLKAAKHGFDVAQFQVGVMFEKGHGTSQDYAQAFHWFLEAANQGNQGEATAQYNIGLLYRYGLGVPRDVRKAMEWFEAAANQGFSNAQEAIRSLQPEKPRHE
ncbi:hypothetical protein EC991_010817 [Linnemannia zychae]|nr:hypothetical protein EC991_010817 [Linnemannia zychae]